MEKRYRLSIVEMVPKTEEELAAQRDETERRRYNGGYTESSSITDMVFGGFDPLYKILPGILQVELTQEEYDKLRHAVIAK